jgi:ABC-type multidrug transport system permease subunit
VGRGDAASVLVIPPGFAADLAAGRGAPVQLLLDGADANSATIAYGYAERHRGPAGPERGADGRATVAPITGEIRTWYNPTLESRNMIVPGLIAVIMMTIAAMLTALTIAREWERGTMEQLASTPATRWRSCWASSSPTCSSGGGRGAHRGGGVVVFGVPFRARAGLLRPDGPLPGGRPGAGMFISAAAKSQFLATQMALIATLLPAMLLSGFLFEIAAMPKVLQAITYAGPRPLLRGGHPGDHAQGRGPRGALGPVGSSWSLRRGGAGAGHAGLPEGGGVRGLGLDRMQPTLRKELRQIFRDPRMKRLIFVAPVIQLVVFGYAVNTDIRETPLFLVDHDRRRVSGAGGRPHRVGLLPRGGRSDPAEAWPGRSTRGAPSSASRSPPTSPPTSAPDGAHRCRCWWTGATPTPPPSPRATRCASSGTHRAADGRRGPRLPARGVDLRIRAWFNPDLASRVYNVPAVLGVIVLLMALLLTAMTVVRERELGTLEQLHGHAASSQQS